jgi:Omp85 superfamily domain/Surface antigen variable number repeat
MTRHLIVALAMAGASLPAAAQTPSIPERVGEVRVHGNHTTPDADVLALAEISVGATITPTLLSEATTRLRQSGRFSDVEIRKRFRSIADPSDILVIVLVDELPGVSETDLTPSPMKRVWGAGMWLPVLDYADGYGFTYGARFSFVNALGRRSRISVPLTWGGERRAAVEVDRTFDRGPFSRIEGALSIYRRENPRFEIGDLRKEARVRGERRLTSWFRVGGGMRITNVRFGSIDETHTAPGLDFIVDTRRDPAYPRNAIHATIGWERLLFDDRPDAGRRATDLRGYIGLIGPSVLALRATTTQSTAPVPAYEQALLGGASGLRGYHAGYRVGDNLAAASMEVRVPLNSPLDLGRFGVKGFIDYGTVYPYGAKLSDQTFDRGIGGGVFLTATVVSMGLDVAWPESGKPRWHFGLGVSF